jgi:O-antigen/teichoic acid export membrane protein
MLKAFIRDTAIYSIPSIFSRGLAIILIPLYTRVLTPADYGSFDLFFVFATLVSLTVALEVAQGVARYYSDEKDAERRVLYASSAFWFTIFCYTVFLGTSFIYSNELSRLVMGQGDLESSFQVGVIYIFINGAFYLIQNQFRWEFRSVHYAIVSTITTVVTALLSIILTYGVAWGLKGLLLGMVGGALAGCLYGLWYLRHSFRFRFQWARLKEMLIFSAPLVPSGIAVFVGLYIDRLMINHYSTLDDVGIFGMGFRVASIVGVVIVGFQVSLTPLIYSHYRDPATPPQLARIFRIFVSFALLMFLVVSLFAKEILMVLTVPAYYDAASIVVFLVPAILLSNMYIFAPGTAIEKKTHLILWINVAGAVFNVFLNALLIPSFGIHGAAAAKLLSYSLVFGAYMWYSQKLYHVPHNWRLLAKATLLVAVIAYWLPQINLSFEMMLAFKFTGLAIGVMVILASGLVQLSELQRLKDIILKRLSVKRD